MHCQLPACSVKTCFSFGSSFAFHSGSCFCSMNISQSAVHACDDLSSQNSWMQHALLPLQLLTFSFSSVQSIATSVIPGITFCTGMMCCPLQWSYLGTGRFLLDSFSMLGLRRLIVVQKVVRGIIQAFMLHMSYSESTAFSRSRFVL